MRNIFDQYESPENRLTHALVSTLHSDRALVRPFLRWLKAKNVPGRRRIRIEEQRVPGQEAESDEEGEEGLPDACFYDEDGWAVLLESKIQAGISITQLRRHQRTAARYGYDDAYVVLIAVDRPKRQLPGNMHFVEWKDVYQWFCRRSQRSDWARRFTDYVQALETRLITQEYRIRGTLTMFSGFRFNDEYLYTYHEGKRLLRLMSQHFRNDKRLIRELRLDPNGPGRPAITRGENGRVWDVIPLRLAKGHALTAYPHVTINIQPGFASVAITVPNSVKGGIRARLRKVSAEEFGALLEGIEKRLRRVLRKVPDARPVIYVLHRHYKTQRSVPEVDGQIEVDLRTLVDVAGPGLKHQPMWIDAIHGILTHRRTNLQLGLSVHFPFTARITQTPGALRVMSNAWIAMKPMLAFLLK